LRLLAEDGFLIAEISQPGEAHAIAERLRAEVAAIPWGATASVGVASITRPAGDLEARAVLEHLVDASERRCTRPNALAGIRRGTRRAAGFTAYRQPMSLRE
jgi:hypothetical protein